MAKKTSNFLIGLFVVMGVLIGAAVDRVAERVEVLSEGAGVCRVLQ